MAGRQKENGERQRLPLSIFQATIFQGTACVPEGETPVKGLPPVLQRVDFSACRWSGRLDLNQRPLDPQSSTLPGCATPRQFNRVFPKGTRMLPAAGVWCQRKKGLPAAGRGEKNAPTFGLSVWPRAPDVYRSFSGQRAGPGALPPENAVLTPRRPSPQKNSGLPPGLCAEEGQDMWGRPMVFGSRRPGQKPLPGRRTERA